jgi:hypothetical protein
LLILNKTIQITTYIQIEIRSHDSSAPNPEADAPTYLQLHGSAHVAR